MSFSDAKETPVTEDSPVAPSPEPKPRQRRILLVCITVTVLLAGFITAGWRVYMNPQTDPLRPADAIVVLGGTPYERFDVGLDLAKRGYAPYLLISQSTGADDRNMDKYCKGHFTFTVSCFIPDPWTTEGEAQEIRSKAQKLGWHHIIVITFTPHVSRARYIVGKCFDGELTMVASPAPSGVAFWSWMFIRQSGSYVKAFLTLGC
ncbi:YdcF family protein [Mycobacteroides abscessus subsp. bolletii]|uniref:YdcF family protein n=1 Tax=Mycobacteroides abscessus TaxID=36809 RepID=UPI0019D10CEA|nr:YdcF family protein [Mycobacteroides abscessus]MBN7303165.1 YdcF family protein [Mycobacteroides abscessus subsp. bolletii]